MIVGVLCSAIGGGLTGVVMLLGSDAGLLHLLLGYSGGGLLAVLAFLATCLANQDFRAEPDL